jgi:hypothetical protein
MRSLALFVAMGAWAGAVLLVSQEVEAAPVSGAAIYVVHDDLDHGVIVCAYLGNCTYRGDVFNREGGKIASFRIPAISDYGFSIDHLASGDVTGDGLAELLVADDGHAFGSASDDSIGDVHIFSAGGTLIRTLPKSKVNFTEHDGFAVGDVTGDGIAEILIANDGDHKVHIFDQFGNKIRYAFPADFNKGNSFAVGDINGDGKAEILVAHQSDLTIVIFDQFGTRLRAFDYRTFEIELAVGDIDGDGKAEILVADKGLHTIAILDQFGKKIGDFPADFNPGNRFAVGDLDGDGKDEFLVGHQSDHDIVIFDQFGNKIGDFPADFTGGDELAVEHSARDSDGDGLLDTWEINGLRDTNGNLILDANGRAVLPPGRADPKHKDLFLEFDWAPGQQPTRAAIATLKAAFAAAPIGAGGINNPDGLPGINLFVDTGSLSDAMGLVGDNLGGGNQLPATPAVGCLDANFYSMKNGMPAVPGSPAIPAQFDPNRARVFRYGISGNPGVSPPCAGGQGEIGGNDFIEYNHDAGTIMHEFGHTLGLRHGGNENANCKPNYVSVMNYDNQFGIGRVGGGTIVDYSPPRTTMIPGSIPPRFARGGTPLPTLLEFFLRENIILDPTDTVNSFVFVNSLGAKTPWPLNQPPDYNANGTTTDFVIANIDTVGLSGQPAGCGNNVFSVLTGGFDDWSNIALNFHHFSDSANAASNPATEHELTLQELIALEQELNRNEITTNLGIIRSGFRYNRATQRFVQQVTLKNVSNNPISGPISLVLDSLSNNATLANKTGFTANFPPLGSPFVTIDVDADDVLGPQESATITLEFAKGPDGGITYRTRVLTGDLPP